MEKEEFGLREKDGFGGKKVKSKKRRLLIILICISIFFIIFSTAAFVVTYKYYKYLEVIASQNKNLLTTPSPTPKPVAKKTKTATTTANPDIKKCESLQATNPDPLLITTDAPGIKKNSEEYYYEIFGSSISDLSNQLYDCGPKYDGDSFAGLTTDYINWAYLLKFTTNGSCRVDNLAVGVNVRIYYPKWEAGERATEEVKTRWNEMLSSLTVHEQGHQQIDYDGAQKIFNSISALTGLSCNNLEETVKTETQKIIDEITQNNKNYDNETNHGETQGATL